MAVVNRFKKQREIVIRFTGGLGNQLFQYAAGRFVSCHTGFKLRFDITAYLKNNCRTFELDNFSIKGDNIRASLISNLIFWAKVKAGLYKNYEETFPFDLELFKNVQNNTILTGYWQNERYFAEIKDIILEDFTFKKSNDFDKLLISTQIKQSNSVAIHIRRGDYVSNKLFYRVHGICSMEYYQKSIEYIARKIEKPVFYVFSDDMEWVKTNIRSEYPIFYIDSSFHTELRINSSIIDLYLMSKCKHNIIANSSFSWWGAWLNQNPGKIVIAPTKWFNDESLDTSGLIPSTWIRI